MSQGMWRGLALGALGLWMSGCGSTADLSCTSDKDCLESEICHPDELMCVQLCTTSANCPDTAKTCEAIGGSNTTKICKCKTDKCLGTMD